MSSEIIDEDGLLNLLTKIEKDDSDALLCFNHGVIRGEYKLNTGHVVVFDRVVDGKIRIVDASPRNPKWKVLEPALLFDAIKRHGDENAGGIWHLTRS